MEEINLFNYQSKYGLNSNFDFANPEYENMPYLTTSLGKRLPFIEFNTQKSMFREKQEDYGDDFFTMERMFSKNKHFSFTSGSTINSQDDIAWMFKALESESIEHTFILYRFDDGDYFAQHLSSGTYDSANADLRSFAGIALEMGSVSITLIHNHPSGNLKSSQQDINLLNRIKDFFRGTAVVVESAIIINTRSGKYLVFDENYEKQHQIVQNSPEQYPVKLYSFDKQLFKANYNPLKIKSQVEVAAWISTQKFGISDKTEIILVNNSLIVGKFILSQHNQIEQITKLCTRYGANSCIIYGNNITDNLYNDYKYSLGLSGFILQDAFRIESGNYYSLLTQEEIKDNKIEQARKEIFTKNYAPKNQNEVNPSSFAISKISNQAQDATMVKKRPPLSREDYYKRVNERLDEINSLIPEKERTIPQVIHDPLITRGKWRQWLAESSSEEMYDKVIALIKDNPLLAEQNFLTSVDKFLMVISPQKIEDAFKIKDALIEKGASWSGIDYRVMRMMGVDEYMGVEIGEDFDSELRKLGFEPPKINSQKLPSGEDLMAVIDRIDHQINDEIMAIIPDDLKGTNFHIRVSKEIAEVLVAEHIVPEIMNMEYGPDDDWVGMTKDDLDEDTLQFDDEYQTFEIDLTGLTKVNVQALLHEIKTIAEDLHIVPFHEIPNHIKFEGEEEFKIPTFSDDEKKNVSLQAAKDPFLLLHFDEPTQAAIKQYITDNNIYDYLSAEEFHHLSDIWARELSNPTLLSAGMTATQIDEKQSHFYRNYNLRKLGTLVKEHELQNTDTPMKTYTTTQGQKFQISHANALPSEHGNKKITVEIEDIASGQFTNFSATTNNMPDYDKASHLEGQHKYEALFELVQSKLDGEISQRIQENTSKEQSLYDEASYYPAENLPDDWQWQIYPDGSGSLLSPEGKDYFQLDPETHEYKKPTGKNEWWEIPSYEGFNFRAVSEQEILNNGLVEGYLSPPLSSQEKESLKTFINNQNTNTMENTQQQQEKNNELKENLSDPAKYSPAKNLPKGWQWQDYEDGSGVLKSPEGKSYLEYNRSVAEYKEAFGTDEWREMRNDWWHLPDYDGFDFKTYAENQILEYGLSDNYLNPPLSNQEKESLSTFINNKNTTKMENTQQHQEKNNELKVGQLASIIVDKRLFKGVVDSIDHDNNRVQLKDKINNKGINAPLDKVYGFFPGQKYDISEIKPLFDTKPAGISFDNLSKEDKTNLMMGYLNKTLLTGTSKKEGMDKEFNFKFRPEFNSERQQLELKPYFQQPNFDLLQGKVFGKEISNEQIETLKSGKSIQIDQVSKTGKDYTASYHYDADLNQVIFDKFVDKKTQQIAEKQEQKPERGTKTYSEDFLRNDVTMFDNARKINMPQLNKMCLELDQYQLEEFLTDFGLERDMIEMIYTTPDWKGENTDITSAKKTILDTINSAAEKVDLFKEKFHQSTQVQSQGLKR